MGPTRVRCRVDVGWMLGRCGVDVGWMWSGCGVDVGWMGVDGGGCRVDTMGGGSLGVT